MSVLFLHQKIRVLFFVASVAVFCFFSTSTVVFAQNSTTTMTTTVRITICGDGVVGDGEDCDNGYARNFGQYSTTIAESQCYPGCYNGSAPYCGDEILGSMYGEECDDANNTAGDGCSSVCQNETDPIEVNPPIGGDGGVGGGGGGSGSTRGPGARDGTISMQNPTRVIIDGRAYPNSTVYVLQDGKQVAVLQTNSKAEFHYEANGVTPGPVIFGFWAEDSAKRRSVIMTTTFQVVQNAVTTVSGLYLPPTIDVFLKILKQGEKLDAFGESVASSTVLIYFDAVTNPVEITESFLNGKWTATLDTKSLTNEKFHTVKAKTETLASDNTIKRSGFSQSVGFYVGSKELKEAVSPDINKDEKVNIVDFSILLFYWGTSEVTCDFNIDGKINLTDFSIMLYSWTG
jgi:cysteine-rich repeat protein